jgi:hypothetical protein
LCPSSIPTSFWWHQCNKFSSTLWWVW